RLRPGSGAAGDQRPPLGCGRGQRRRPRRQRPHDRRGLGRPAARKDRGGTLMKFEVEVQKSDTGEWVAEAVEYKVSAKGLSEKEALGRLMEALSAHFKQQKSLE